MVGGPRVFVIGSDRAIRTLVGRVLTAAGYRVEDSGPSPAALRAIAKRKFDLLILDINPPPGGDPKTVPGARERSALPILVLCDNEDAAVHALDSGADDYVRKPVSIKELVARVKHTLRRKARQEGKPVPLVIGELEIDLLCRRISSRGQDVHLSVRLYEVLKVVAEGAGKVLTHEEILRAVWGGRHANRLQYLRVAIQELRRRLEPDPARPRYILTETGVGYRLAVQRPAAGTETLRPWQGC
jgi:two-component system, OmpR family, KDP operon response regulator KdpE